MSLRVKEKLDKLLHREHLGKDGKQNDIGVGQDNSAPSPVIARTSADKGDQRQHRKQGSLHNYVQNKRRSMSRPRPTSQSNADTPVPVAQTDHLPQTQKLAREAAPKVTSQSDIIAYLNTLNLQGDGPYTAPEDSEGSQRPVSAKSIALSGSRDPYQEHVANHNLSRDETVLAGGIDDVHAIRKVLEKDRGAMKQRGASAEFRRSAGNSLDQRRSLESRSRVATAPRPTDPPNFSRPGRPSLDQDQPVIIPERAASLAHRRANPQRERQPSHTLRRVQDEENLQTPQHGAGTRSSPTNLKASNEATSDRFAIQNSDQPIDLSGVVDLTNTEDTTVHERVAPAVTHETVRVDTHEIITEEITREIHNHDIFHRILPVVDIEVLPPRHFIRTPAGGLYEISEERIPGGAAQNLRLQQLFQKAVNENMSMMTEAYNPGPRGFTARKFEGREGDEKEYVAPDGKYKYTEQTWVHPPILQTGGEETGQTMAFHFGRPKHTDSPPIMDVAAAGARRSSITTRKPVPTVTSPGGGNWL